MADCELCKLKQELKIYEDEICTAVLSDAVLGHVKIVPKKHVKELHELDKKEVTHLFKIATYASTVVFQLLKLQGTNIMANTMNPHFCLDIVPRKFDDSFELQWERKPMPDEELASAEKKIKDKTDFIGVQKPKTEIKETPKKELKEDKGVINYLLKQLLRLP
jgi:diadenosine tetraphosphate (Ap4A) HIT family hydrolase